MTRVVSFDLETCGVEEMHRRTDFVRLGAVYDGIRYDVSADGYEIVRELNRAQVITGANILNFDLIALAKWHGADYEALAAKAVDSMVVERHLNPVAAKGKEKAGYRGLDKTAARYGVEGKTDDIKKLARKHGGFDRIPLDDVDYNEYLKGDVRASYALYEAMGAKLGTDDVAYLRREHATQTVMGRITLEGFRVDVPELDKRCAAGEARQAERKARLVEQYGMPETGTYPHRSNEGKAAFRAALEATGVNASWIDRNWKLNKDGSLATAKEVLDEMREKLSRGPAAVELIDTIKSMNGERTVYGTIHDHLIGDRVHPEISPEQSSGRWSVTNPGLTVLGKRSGKHVERGVLLADEGDVLVAIDADQVDARGVAGMCQDPEYMKLFEPGRDLHSEVARMVFGVELVNGKVKPEDKEWRDRAKVSAHGWSYGLQPAGMARQQGIDISITEQFDRGMREAFPVLAAWREEIRTLAGALPYGEEAPEGDEYRILHTGFGRPVRVERNRAFTQATAQLGQGTTRDIMAEAALALPFEIRRKIRAVVHDEFVFSLPRDGVEDAVAMIKERMSFDFRGVAITFGASKPGNNWAECYE